MVDTWTWIPNVFHEVADSVLLPKKRKEIIITKISLVDVSYKVENFEQLIENRQQLAQLNPEISM